VDPPKGGSGADRRAELSGIRTSKKRTGGRKNMGRGPGLKPTSSLKKLGSGAEKKVWVVYKAAKPQKRDLKNPFAGSFEGGWNPPGSDGMWGGTEEVLA